VKEDRLPLVSRKKRIEGIRPIWRETSVLSPMPISRGGFVPNCLLEMALPKRRGPQIKPFLINTTRGRCNRLRLQYRCTDGRGRPPGHEPEGNLVRVLSKIVFSARKRDPHGEPSTCPPARRRRDRAHVPGRPRPVRAPPITRSLAAGVWGSGAERIILIISFPVR